MTIYFVGSEDFDFGMVGNPTGSSSGARTGYTRGALAGNSTNSYFYAQLPNLTSCWCQCRQSFASLGGDLPFLILGDPTTAVALRLVLKGATAGDPFAIQTWDGASWVEQAVGGANALNTSVPYLGTTEIVNFGANGTIRFYHEGVLNVEWTGDLRGASGLAAISAVRMSYGSTAFHAYQNEVLITDEDPRTWSVVTLEPNAAGNAATWTGDYTAVDETVLTDADYLSSGTANQVEMMNLDTLPATSDLVKCVWVSARAVRGATGPQHLQLGVRSGTTDSFSPDKTLETVYGRVAHEWALNPATGLAWTQAEITALQAGVKSTA